MRHLGSVRSLPVVPWAHGRVGSLLSPPSMARRSVLGARVLAEPHAWLGLDGGAAVVRVSPTIAPHHGAGGGEELVQGRGGSRAGRVLLVLTGEPLEASSAGG